MNIICPINNTSYGLVAQNLIYALSKRIEVCLFPIDPHRMECEYKYKKSIEEALVNAKFFDSYDRCIRLWHQHDMSQFVGLGTHIGFPIFELDTLTRQERHHLNSCDQLFVCSEWAKQVLQNNQCDTPKVIPLGVDTEIFKPTNINNPTTVFLNVGKWEKRKGHDIIFELFDRAFDLNDNVELWMLPNNPFLNEEEAFSWNEKTRNCKLASKVKILPRLYTQQDVANVMNQATCGLFPSRAEGWGMPILEMMACGKHVITTDYSGQTEFCARDSSMLVPITELEVAHDNKWFFGQGKWSHIGEEEKLIFIDYMVEIYQRHQDNKLEGNEGGIEIASQFSWDNSAKLIIEEN
jgi:glycosyltransferase involved in cell wall biosynthesis